MTNDPTAETNIGDPANRQALSASSSPANADASFALSAWQSLIVALVAGVVAWLILDAILPVFQMPEHLRNLSGNLSVEQRDQMYAAGQEAKMKNSAVALSVFAAILSAGVALAELLARGQVPRAIWGVPVAAAIAAAGGAAAALAGGALIESLRLENLLTKTVLVQCGGLGITGLAVGIAVSATVFRVRRLVNCALGGLLGGVMAAMIFPMAVSLLPRVRTESLIPDAGVGRLLWISVASALIGAALAGLGKEKA